MPIYLFRCPQCEHEFRELLWPTEPEDAVRCPQCKAQPVEKQPAAFAVRSSAGNGARTEEPPPFCGRCGQNRPPCDA